MDCSCHLGLSLGVTSSGRSTWSLNPKIVTRVLSHRHLLLCIALTTLCYISYSFSFCPFHRTLSFMVAEILSCLDHWDPRTLHIPGSQLQFVEWLNVLLFYCLLRVLSQLFPGCKELKLCWSYSIYWVHWGRAGKKPWAAQRGQQRLKRFSDVRAPVTLWLGSPSASTDASPLILRDLSTLFVSRVPATLDDSFRESSIWPSWGRSDQDTAVDGAADSRVFIGYCLTSRKLEVTVWPQWKQLRPGWQGLCGERKLQRGVWMMQPFWAFSKWNILSSNSPVCRTYWKF